MATPQQQGRYFKEIGLAAARAADEKKGEDIAFLHIKPVSPIADYLLLVGVTSPAHMDAVEDHIRRTLKKAGAYALHRDGRQSELWRVLDYGGLLVHLMHPEARAFYAFDKLFHGARRIAFEEPRGRKSDA